MTLYLKENPSTEQDYILFPVVLNQIAFLPATIELCEQVSIVLGVTVVIAYLLIWRFCREMATFEFSSPVEY